MSDTPERIWVDDERPEGGEVHVWADLCEQSRQWAVEYIRANVHAARIADLERHLAKARDQALEDAAIEVVKPSHMAPSEAHAAAEIIRAMKGAKP